MIPQAFIEEVQSRTDIAELIASYIPLKRAGRNFRALCPFHSEKTPSFLVSPQKQIFHCFGCGAGGGAVQFLMLYEKVSFVETIEILAKRAGLAIPYQQGKRDNIKSSLYEVVSEAALFFHKNLLEGSVHQPVCDYLNKRGVDKEIIKKFCLGFAAGRNTLLNFLRKKNVTLDIMEKAALITYQKDGWRDLFWERVSFPIFDVRSRPVGFGARLWKEKKDAPKYINSLENPLYCKREHLYGLNFSKDDILKNDSAIVVEGYLDMIIPFMKGIRNIVASLGTALTLEQIRLIRRYTSNITLIFDSDKAGQIATLRSIDLLLENDLKVKVARMPSGFDPDSLARAKGKDYFLRLVEESQDFFDYKVGILKNIYDIESIEGKSKIAQELFLTINKLKSEIAKYEYIKRLSGVLKVKEEILIAEFKKISSSVSLRRDNVKIEKGILSLTEKVLFKFILVNPKAVVLMKKNLNAEDFPSLLARKTADYIFKNYSQEKTPSYTKILGEIEDKEISGFISAILMDEGIPSDKDTFKNGLIKLKEKRMRNLKEKVRDKIREAERKGNDRECKALLSKFYKIKSSS